MMDEEWFNPDMLREAQKKEDILNGRAVYALSSTLAFRDCSKTGHCTSKRYASDQVNELNARGYENVVGYIDTDIREMGSYCTQEDIHWQCAKHPAREYVKENGRYICAECADINKKSKKSYTGILFDEELMRKKAKASMNITYLQKFNLVRLDDVYVTEVKDKVKLESDYGITSTVKTDKDGDTEVMLLVGKKGHAKSQIFIKPEKGQLTTDHNDTDMMEYIAEIKVRFADREISHKFTGGEK